MGSSLGSEQASPTREALMARNQPRPQATSELRLEPLSDLCRACEGKLWVAYHNARTVTTLEGLVRLRLVVRRCVNPECELYQQSRRPEQEGAFALPQGEFGLDVIALVGALRHAHHRSVPEIHRELLGRGVAVSERTVTNLLERYEELVALRISERAGLRERLKQQQRARGGSASHTTGGFRWRRHTSHQC